MYNSPKGKKDDNFTRQGSLRKVIPPESSKTKPTNIFGRHNEDLNNVYQTYRQEYMVLAEYKMLQTENIQGVYVIPSRKSPLLWFGVIFVRNGFYEDGVFRFTITLDENFPDCEHPKVIFQSEMFHPVIYPETKELHLLNAFPVWNKSEQHIWQVLKYIEWIFSNTGSSVAHAVNNEATEMYNNDKDSFNKKVNEIVKSSQEHLYDDPPTEDEHYITFQKYDTEIHEKIRTQILDDSENEIVPKTGLSWVYPGSLQPLGRPPSPQSETES